jgi:AcrR family transcriptional regulator
MPYPSQVTLEQIMAAAADLIEAHGVEHVTLAAVADRLSVKTPSLYRYVDGRIDLLRHVNLSFLQGLFDALEGAVATAGTGDAPRAMLAVMLAYRAYAHAHPQQYLMSFAHRVDELRPDEDLLVRLVLPLQGQMAEIAEPARSLAALRGLLAYVHGFVMLELTDQLRRGGDLSADFKAGAQAVLTGWQRAS